MKKTNAVAVLLLLAASVAGAQMMGGGSGSGMPGHSTSGRFSGGMSGIDMSMGAGMMSLPVAEDGTVFTARATKSGNVTEWTLTAIRPSGVIGWTYKLENSSMSFAKIVGTNVVVATNPFGTGSTATTPLTGSLVAVSIASGTKQWERALDGYAMIVEPYADGMYVVVVKPNFTRRSSGNGNNGMPGMNGTRALVAVGNDGAIKWSLPLDQ